MNGGQGRNRETSEGGYHIDVGRRWWLSWVVAKSGFCQDRLYTQWAGTNLG